MLRRRVTLGSASEQVRRKKLRAVHVQKEAADMQKTCKQKPKVTELGARSIMRRAAPCGGMIAEARKLCRIAGPSCAGASRSPNVEAPS